MWGPSKTSVRVTEDRHPEWVVLLNGIGPDFFTIEHMAKPLAEAGFSILSIAYPSTRHPIRKLASEHIGPTLAEHIPAHAEKVHFVTLSMGGIVTRALMQTPFRPPNLGRVVMLAPPNHGSEVSDHLSRWPFYRWSMGPGGQELVTAADSTPNTLGPADFELGILTGDRWYDPWFAWMFKGPNDGKVSVESAKLEGMKAFRVVHASHYDIMMKAEVRQATIQFLREGCFEAPTE